MGIKFTNNAEGTLTAGLGSGDTTNMTLTAGDGLLFPTVVLASGDYFYCTLVNSSGAREIVQITEHQDGTDVFQTFVREQDDTTALGFSIGDKVQIRLPKVILEEFIADIAANLAAIESNDSDISAIQAKSTADEQVLYGPSGLTMYIYNPTGEIPVGWSAKSGPADCLLAIAGGSQAYNVAGENTAGSWTPSGHVHSGPAHVHTMPTHVHSGPSHTHTMPTHVHTTPGHTLSAAEMPAHTHVGDIGIHDTAAGCLRAPTVNAGVRVYAGNITTGAGAADATYGTTASAGSGGSHAHGNAGATDPGDTNASGTDDTGATDPGDTNSSGTDNTGSSKEPSTDRPFAAVGLLIERD
jgi:hypothetical protein